MQAREGVTNVRDELATLATTSVQRHRRDVVQRLLERGLRPEVLAMMIPDFTPDLDAGGWLAS